MVSSSSPDGFASLGVALELRYPGDYCGHSATRLGSRPAGLPTFTLTYVSSTT